MMIYEDLANSATKIIEEIGYTNLLQSMVDYGNSNVYTSFKMRLEMDRAARLEGEDGKKEWPKREMSQKTLSGVSFAGKENNQRPCKTTN